jgi:hypothetical protein
MKNKIILFLILVLTSGCSLFGGGALLYAEKLTIGIGDSEAIESISQMKDEDEQGK